VSLLAWAVTQLLRKVGKYVEDIKYFVFHQASQPFLQAVIRELNIPRHSVPINCDRYGNTVNATLPITLHELAKSGDLHRGDLIVLAAVGDGWQYGSALVEW
ncbi:MAG: 3-oxoacyl-[acyl-carrier-protein] synthase III C-terminal domain-containing protein, partial [Patescibacteria group bacterium]